MSLPTDTPSTKTAAFETRRTASMYKKPARALTHKPVSVSNETHSKLVALQLDKQYKLRKKVSLDDIVVSLLEMLAEKPPVG